MVACRHCSLRTSMRPLRRYRGHLQRTQGSLGIDRGTESRVRLGGDARRILSGGDWLCHRPKGPEKRPGRGGQERVRLGTQKQGEEALAAGSTATTINTSYVERLHGTQRHFNARKARKVYTFSKELVFHVAVTWLCVVYYNFGWFPRTLREKVQENPPGITTGRPLWWRVSRSTVGRWKTS